MKVHALPWQQLFKPELTVIDPGPGEKEERKQKTLVTVVCNFSVLHATALPLCTLQHIHWPCAISLWHKCYTLMGKMLIPRNNALLF